MKKTFWNTFTFGILSGILTQATGFILFLILNRSLVGYTERSLFAFFTYLAENDTGRTQIIPKLLSLGALPALLLFFVFIWTERLKSARGVIASAFLLAVTIILLKVL